MCKCNPLIRTPFCGKGDCKPPTLVELYGDADPVLLARERNLVSQLRKEDQRTLELYDEYIQSRRRRETVRAELIKVQEDIFESRVKAVLR